MTVLLLTKVVGDYYTYLESQLSTHTVVFRIMHAQVLCDEQNFSSISHTITHFVRPDKFRNYDIIYVRYIQFNSCTMISLEVCMINFQQDHVPYLFK